MEAAALMCAEQSVQNQLIFLYLNNLGNTITYICLFATGADLLINQFYKKNQH